MSKIRLLTPEENENAPEDVRRRRFRGMTRLLSEEYHAGELDSTALVKVWMLVEFPLSYLPARLWREMFESTGYLVYGDPADRPPAPVRLYRGVSDSRVARRLAKKHTGLPPELGWSWSRDIEAARAAALARDPDHPAVYVVDAPPEALLARVPGGEYVVDTARLARPPERIE